MYSGAERESVWTAGAEVAVDFLIRRIRADEGEALRTTRLRALADAPEAFGSEYEEQKGRPVSEWAEQARETSTAEWHAIFFAEVNGEQAGMVRGYAAEGERVTCDLASMWVAPELRGTGASRALVEAVLDWAAGSGFERVVLWVTEGNEAAERLYSSCGFEFTGRRELLRPHRPEVAREMARGIEG
jgi:GNAT superfamily N-acetyltransferase